MTHTPSSGAGAPTFRNLGIAPAILSVLDRLSFIAPTPIQERAILPGIEGKDVIGVAQTGTGKTLAFAVPLIQRLLSADSRALILVPTRELAIQVDETFQKVGTPLGVRSTIVIGGAAMGPQISALRRDPKVIIATPGRLIDHLEQRTVRLDGISMLVLDEADRMLDMGFLPQINRILAVVPKDRQTMLFSATLSREILSIAGRAMKTPTQVEVAPQGTTAERVTQELFIVRKDEKPRLLKKVLGDYRGSTLVFTRTKHGARRVARAIAGMGHTAAEIHSDRSLGQRKAALEGFKTGKYRVLVATDIVARGIDVKGVELVLNYDLPSTSADYVHRIGRTARAGAEGHAISFVLPEERGDIRDIERLTRKAIPFSPLPELPPAPPFSERSHASYAPARPMRHGRGRGPRDRGERGHGHSTPQFTSTPGGGTRRVFRSDGAKLRRQRGRFGR